MLKYILIKENIILIKIITGNFVNQNKIKITPKKIKILDNDLENLSFHCQKIHVLRKF